MRNEPKILIRVAKPPRAAFNKERPASRLLLDQMIQVAAALAAHLKDLDNRAVEHPVTEAQVGEFVRLATSILHPHTAAYPAKKSQKTTTRKSKGSRRG